MFWQQSVWRKAASAFTRGTQTHSGIHTYQMRTTQSLRSSLFLFKCRIISNPLYGMHCRLWKTWKDVSWLKTGNIEGGLVIGMGMITKGISPVGHPNERPPDVSKHHFLITLNWYLSRFYVGTHPKCIFWTYCDNDYHSLQLGLVISPSYNN